MHVHTRHYARRNPRSDTRSEAGWELVRQTGIGLDFAGLREGGTVPYGGEPIVQFPGGVVPTPSGCVEIASARAGADGLPFAHADPRPGDDMLRLLSPASPWLLNDSFQNDAKVTERIGSAKVAALHPLDAADRGLAAGDPVVLSNATGRLELELELSEHLPRGVALSPKGRWPKREATNANVNVLNPGTKSDMGDATSVHGVEVRVSRAG
jgi:anaerobic selenocysteine-containing dehydrogenase